MSIPKPYLNSNSFKIVDTFYLYSKLLLVPECWPKIYVWCTFGQNKISGLNAKAKSLQETFLKCYLCYGHVPVGWPSFKIRQDLNAYFDSIFIKIILAIVKNKWKNTLVFSRNWLKRTQTIYRPHNVDKNSVQCKSCQIRFIGLDL